MQNLFEEGLKQLENGEDFALVTIISDQGSSPRSSGARFLARGDRSIVGTIGGGLFEARAMESAMEAIEEKRSFRAGFQFKGEDADSLEMICGGQVEVLVEFISHEDPFMAPLFRELARLMKERLKGLYITQVEMDKGRVGPIHRMLLREGEDFRLGALKSEDAIFERLLPPRLARGPQVFEINDPPSLVYGERIRSLGTTYVFGLGHVGACVCHLARYADFRVVGIDDRSEFADPEKLIDADQVIDGPFEDAWGRIGVDNDSYIVIVTRGHAHDRMVLARALKTEALYIGMIGSRRKNRIIFEDLVSEGFTQEDINRVYAPIGLDIAADTPEEIGFSIVSQMIKVRNSSPGPQ